MVTATILDSAFNQITPTYISNCTGQSQDIDVLGSAL